MFKKPVKVFTLLGFTLILIGATANVQLPNLKTEKTEGEVSSTDGIFAESHIYGVQELSLIVSESGYFPQKLGMRKNIPVRLYVATATEKAMCVISDDFGIKKGIIPSKMEEINFVPKTAGVYKFYCPINSLKGEFVVRE